MSAGTIRLSHGNDSVASIHLYGKMWSCKGICVQSQPKLAVIQKSELTKIDHTSMHLVEYEILYFACSN